MTTDQVVWIARAFGFIGLISLSAGVVMGGGIVREAAINLAIFFSVMGGAIYYGSGVKK